MRILHAKSGKYHEVKIVPIEKKEWRLIEESKRFEFDWNKEKQHTVYLLKLVVEEKLLGIVAVVDIPKEFRLHIQLIENSKSNIGKKKEYDFVAGCMLAFVCNLAVEKGYDGFVSLEPKTKLENLYREKYGFKNMGKLFYSSLENSLLLIKKYLEL